MSRDFSCPVFFIKHLLVLIGMPRTDFEFFRIFVELFVFVIDSPAMNTPGSRLESFRFGSFCKHKSHVPSVQNDSLVMNIPASLVVNTPGSLNSPVVNTQGSLNSPVMNTRGVDFLVYFEQA